MKSNCLFHAVWLWIRHGGWLMARRSLAGWFPHFVWAKELPEDLPVSQYVAKPGVPCDVVFDGEVQEKLGPVKPPVVLGWLDRGILAFCIIVVVGWIYLLVNLIAGFWRLLH